MIKKNNCFYCKWKVQGKNCVQCSHPNKVTYIELKKPCSVCGRPNERKSKGCGACIGRGRYCYPNAYDKCDVIVKNIFGFKRYGFKKIAE